MVILGLLLLLSAVGVAVGVVVENTAAISVDALGTTFSLGSGWLFVAGMAAGAVALLGVGLLAAGLKRTRRRRTDLVESRNSLQDLQAERDRLAVELERERATRTSTTAGATENDGGAEIDLDEERRTTTTSRPETVGSGRQAFIHRRR